jgi:hypothetical protein
VNPNLPVDHFLSSVRNNFGPVFERHSLREIGVKEGRGFVTLTAANSMRFLRVTLDRPEGRVYVELGKTIDDEVPGPMILGPTRRGDITSFELGMVLWANTGIRSSQPSLGFYRSERPDDIDEVVSDLAHEVESNATSVLDADENAWEKIVSTMMARTSD